MEYYQELFEMIEHASKDVSSKTTRNAFDATKQMQPLLEAFLSASNVAQMCVPQPRSSDPMNARRLPC